MNDIDSPTLGGGGAPTASKLWGQVAPTPPPPTAPASLLETDFQARFEPEAPVST